MRPIAPLLAHRASDEYAPIRWRPVDRQALDATALLSETRARRLGLDVPAYLASRPGTAATLLALNEAHGNRFFDVDPEVAGDPAAADAAFVGTTPVIDVQTHLVRPSRADTTAAADAVRVPADGATPTAGPSPSTPTCSRRPGWAAHRVRRKRDRGRAAHLDAWPVRARTCSPTPRSRRSREIVDRYAGTGRVLTHTIVHPNLGPAELDAMAEWRETLQPSGWKVYTLWEPPDRAARPAAGSSTTRRSASRSSNGSRALGPHIVCAHKGIGGPIPSLAPVAASPRDIGPAAAAFPDITFVVYHSGYERDPHGEEGVHAPTRHRGVDRLVTSVPDAGIGPGANVYAELGSTWFLMLRRPCEAAHVLGKLLRALGPGPHPVGHRLDLVRLAAVAHRRVPRVHHPRVDAGAVRLPGAHAGDQERHPRHQRGRALRHRRSAPGADPTWLDAARAELAIRLA